jgi:hypothetical protein
MATFNPCMVSVRAETETWQAPLLKRTWHVRSSALQLSMRPASYLSFCFFARTRVGGPNTSEQPISRQFTSQR